MVLQRVITDDLDTLIGIFPPHLQQTLHQQKDIHDLLEIVLDLGRVPEARFPHREMILSSQELTEQDIEYVVSRIGSFGDDNRAGIARTLHRISAIRNRRGRIVGLTCRVGRAVTGTIQVIQDLIESGKSVLLLGKPGVGKTTMLREVARVLADDLKKRVVIVDTSNEIAGDGDIPHPGIGHARRMQVATPTKQHAVMIEAVENHMPEVIVIDEIGTELEAQAARTIAERGVQLIGTAHGIALENLIMNPTLSDLIGGIQSVTLGDEEAKRRGTQKAILERTSKPTFDIVVEIQSWDKVAIHPDVGEAVDAILRGEPLPLEVRSVNETGEIKKENVAPIATASERMGGSRTYGVRTSGSRTYGSRTSGSEPYGSRTSGSEPYGGRTSGSETFGGRTNGDRLPAKDKETTKEVSRPKLFLFGVNRERFEHMAKEAAADVTIVDDLAQASLFVTSKHHYRRKPQKVRESEEANIPVYVLRSSTPAQVMQFLKSIGRHPDARADAMAEKPDRADSYTVALDEAQDAVNMVKEGEETVELSPQSAYIRRLQHLVAERNDLASQSTGKEPKRRVRIFKG